MTRALLSLGSNLGRSVGQPPRRRRRTGRRAGRHIRRSGGFSADGKSATVKASITNASTGKPTPLELRMSLGAGGGHVTQLWGQGLGTKMFKMMELQYTRTKP